MLDRVLDEEADADEQQHDADARQRVAADDPRPDRIGRRRRQRGRRGCATRLWRSRRRLFRNRARDGNCRTVGIERWIFVLDRTKRQRDRRGCRDGGHGRRRRGLFRRRLFEHARRVHVGGRSPPGNGAKLSFKLGDAYLQRVHARCDGNLRDWLTSRWPGLRPAAGDDGPDHHAQDQAHDGAQDAGGQAAQQQPDDCADQHCHRSLPRCGSSTSRRCNAYCRSRGADW